jgi:hypothetical protein
MKPFTWDTSASILHGLSDCNDAPCLILRDRFVVLAARSSPDRKDAVCAKVKTSCVLNDLSLLTKCG